ncbi:MAG: glycoside hydrolase family 2 protein, partial [Acidobacteriota bacterium]
GDEFKDIALFTQALEARYGKAQNAEDYARKAQALAYEGERAMFEAFGRNKFTSTGVIQWMLNNAWPSMIWHLYDYYLRPGGGYFGSKTACEPLHVQYSYDDRSIAIVNDTLESKTGLTVSAQVFDLQLAQKFSREAPVNADGNAVVRAFALPAAAADWGPTYFVRLSLRDANGKEVSRNFYWLSTKEDEIDWANTKWYYTPTRSHADLRSLASLPGTSLSITTSFTSEGGEHRAHVKVANTGKALAFQVRLKAIDSQSGEEFLPVFWEDNYFPLFPGETRELTVSFPAPANARPAVTAEAWNAAVAR